jgi:iron(III) transport system substrate-binding protein
MRTTSSRRLLAPATALLIGGLLLAGCSDDGGDSSTSGSSDADLVLYTGRNKDLLSPIIEDFTEQTDIEVDVRYGDSAEMGAQILEEGERTPADVFLSQEVGAIGVLDEAGLLSPLPAETVELVDERYRPSEGTNWVGVTGRSRVLVYNPEMVSADELPAGVMELTDPAWEGKVGWAPTNPSFQSFITAMRVTEGEEATKAWLEAMIDNGTVSFENNLEILDAVNNGDLEAGLINHYYWARNEAEQEDQASELHFFDGGDVGALVNATAVAITTTGADDPDAQALVDFLLSTEGQTAFVESVAEYPLVAGIEQPAGVPPIDELEGPAIDLADLESLEQTQALLSDVGLLN